jgi:hypothetical protein
MDQIPPFPKRRERMRVGRGFTRINTGRNLGKEDERRKYDDND